MENSIDFNPSLIYNQPSESTYTSFPDFLNFIPNIKLSDKIVFGKVKSLSNTERGCYATNEYLSSLLGISKRAVTASITKWEKLGVFSRKNIRFYKNGMVIGERRHLYYQKTSPILIEAKAKYRKFLTKSTMYDMDIVGYTTEEICNNSGVQNLLTPHAESANPPCKKCEQHNNKNKIKNKSFLSEKGNFDSLRSSSFPMSPEESSLQETIVVHPLLKGNKKKRTKLALSPPSASTIKESVDSKKKLVGLKKKQDKDKPLPKSLDQAAPVTKVVSTPGIPKIKNGNKIDRSKFKPGVVEIEKKLEDPIALYGKYWNWAKDVLDLWISLSKGHALPTPSTKYHPVYRKTIAHELKLGASQSVLETAIRNYHKALEDPGTIFGAKTVTKSNVLKELTRMNPTKFFKCLCDDRKRELEKITTVNLKPLLLHKKPYRLFLGDYKKDVLTKILYITKVKTKHKELVQKAIEVFDRLNPGIEVPGYKIDQTIKYALEYWNSLLQNKTFVITDRFLSEKIWDANNRHLFDNNLLGVENAIGDPNDMSGPLYLLDLARATAEDRPALIEKIHAKFFFDSCVFDYMRKNDMINFDF